jgi:hypothetical protein
MDSTGPQTEKPQSLDGPPKKARAVGAGPRNSLRYWSAARASLASQAPLARFPKASKNSALISHPYGSNSVPHGYR